MQEHHNPPEAFGAARRHGTKLSAYLGARGPRAGSARDDYYLYDVTFEGETIVAGSRSPECDAARVLFDRGFTGLLAILDANTGKHRTTVNIEAAAKVTVIENRNQSLRFAKWRPYNAEGGAR